MASWTKADVTPCLMVRNEEYWIHYVLQDLVSFFKRAIIIDTGSTDMTVSYIKNTCESIDGSYVQIFREQWGNDPNQLGEGRNKLRLLCDTYWMLLVDGDEIWRPPQLECLMEAIQGFDTSVETVMVGGEQVQDIHKRLMMRDGDLANYDRMHAPGVRWSKTDYPFESHDLESKLARGTLKYADANRTFFWHVRHTQRSRHDSGTYMRRQKLGYFPWHGTWKELPTGWIAPNNRYPNPYFEAVPAVIVTR